MKKGKITLTLFTYAILSTSYVAYEISEIAKNKPAAERKIASTDDFIADPSSPTEIIEVHHEPTEHILNTHGKLLAVEENQKKITQEDKNKLNEDLAKMNRKISKDLNDRISADLTKRLDKDLKKKTEEIHRKVSMRLEREENTELDQVIKDISKPFKKATKEEVKISKNENKNKKEKPLKNTPWFKRLKNWGSELTASYSNWLGEDVDVKEFKISLKKAKSSQTQATDFLNYVEGTVDKLAAERTSLKKDIKDLKIELEENLKNSNLERSSLLKVTSSLVKALEEKVASLDEINKVLGDYVSVKDMRNKLKKRITELESDNKELKNKNKELAYESAYNKCIADEATALYEGVKDDISKLVLTVEELKTAQTQEKKEENEVDKESKKEESSAVAKIKEKILYQRALKEIEAEERAEAYESHILGLYSAIVSNNEEQLLQAMLQERLSGINRSNIAGLNGTTDTYKQYLLQRESNMLGHLYSIEDNSRTMNPYSYQALVAQSQAKTGWYNNELSISPELSFHNQYIVGKQLLLPSSEAMDIANFDSSRAFSFSSPQEILPTRALNMNSLLATSSESNTRNKVSSNGWGLVIN